MDLTPILSSQPPRLCHLLYWEQSRLNRRTRLIPLQAAVLVNLIFIKDNILFSLNLIAEIRLIRPGWQWKGAVERSWKGVCVCVREKNVYKAHWINFCDQITGFSYDIKHGWWTRPNGWREDLLWSCRIRWYDEYVPDALLCMSMPTAEFVKEGIYIMYVCMCDSMQTAVVLFYCFTYILGLSAEARRENSAPWLDSSTDPELDTQYFPSIANPHHHH